MKILWITGPLYPHGSNNANIVSKLLRRMIPQHAVYLLATAWSSNSAKLPETYNGAPVFWCNDQQGGFRRKYLYRAYSSLVDRGGYSDALYAQLLYDEAKKLHRIHSFDAVISNIEPFYPAVAASKLKCGKSVLYVMDPPAALTSQTTTSYRTRMLKQVLKAQDAIVTTPFIKQALIDSGYGQYDFKVIPVGFPSIEPNNTVPEKKGSEKIRLLFCGWLYSTIRSPKYFLDIVSRLDSRFVITFLGKECDQLESRFEIRTKAEIITHRRVPYEAALQAMADNDILINIGNSVPVHMPSKTLEYINTCKPIVNLYKMDDCPTLFYTKRYPLCLNLSEQDPDLDAVTARFIEFCENNKGKTVDRGFIEAEYADCTPEYISKTILDALQAP